MSRGGGSVIHSGVVAQNWAALSLFVQSMSDGGFKCIKFERPGFADFILEFDGKKIICESKKDKITITKLRDTLRSLRSIGREDEILLIGSSIDSRLLKNVEYAKYKTYLREMTQGYFDSLNVREINLLPRVKFWSVTPAMNENAVRGLIERQFDLWLPVTALTDQLFIRRVLERSAKRETYTKEEFLEDITKYKTQLLESDDAEKAQRTVIDRIEEIRRDFSRRGRIAISSNPIQQLVSEPQYHVVAIEQLGKLSDLTLEVFDHFWAATYCSRFSHQVANIFEKNIFQGETFNRENAQYTVGFIEKNAERIRYSFWDEFGYKEALGLLGKIQAVTHEFDIQIVNLAIQFYRFASAEIFYLHQRNGGRQDWILGEIANFLQKVYVQNDISDETRNHIEEFAFSFNLARDDSTVVQDTPAAIFWIVRDSIGADTHKLDEIVQKVICDYEDFYRQFGRGLPYKGWDHFGGTSSNFGGALNIADRAFITSILVPVLRKLSDDERWSYINERISRITRKVNKTKPDFMNRAAIPFLLDWYADGAHAEESCQILGDFIRMHRGIPHKAELIYFQLSAHKGIELSKKWDLLEAGLKEYGYPISTFMDLPFQQLIDAGYPESLVAFEKLLTNDEYMRRQAQFLDVRVTHNIQAAIESDQIFATGLKWLKTYLGSRWFQTGISSFDAYTLRKLIFIVLEKDPVEGMTIVKAMAELEHPTKNEQVVFGSLLRDLPDDYLEMAYRDIVQPLLERNGNAQQLAELLTESEARESIVWFGEKLAKHLKTEWAFEILNFFSTDEDPVPGNRYDQEIGEGKTQLAIDSVRGVVAWTLTQFPVDQIRTFDQRVLELTTVLCDDPSSFVRNYACLALATLAMNRHSKLSGGGWYMEVETAREIENLAFSKLTDSRNHHTAIMLGLAEVFSHIRNISTHKAVEIITLFEEFGGESVFEHLASYVIFLAEFRKEAFSDSWPKERGDVGSYDPSPVQEKLNQLLRGDSAEIRSQFAWNFARLVDEAGDDTDKYERYFAISLKYFRIIAERYDQHVFTSIYRFIEQNLDRHFLECYGLWRACLEIERSACVENKRADLRDYAWWPFSANGSILAKMAVIDQQRFLDDFEFLVNYPDGTNYAHDLGIAIERLVDIDEPQDQIERIFHKLMLWHYDDYRKWKQRSTKK